MVAVESEIPEFLKPKLRLFLSADIVGSTALKQSPRSTDSVAAEWFGVIQGFYSVLRREFLMIWDDCAASGLDYLGSRPTLWKVVGDEVIFVKELSDHRQVYLALCCWREAVARVKKIVLAKHKRLDLKCTAWTAGFPVMNKEVVVQYGDAPLGHESGEYFRDSGLVLNKLISSGPDPDYSVDYIGPGIDIGFRLGAHSSPRKMVLSVGVAYIISSTNRPLDVPYVDQINIGYDGGIVLKGVFGGAPYPIFWADMADGGDLYRLEDELLGRKHCSRSDIQDYCAAYYKANGAYTFPPFIDGATEERVNARPDWYAATHAVLVKNYQLSDLPDAETEAQAEAEAKAESEARVESKPDEGQTKYGKLLDSLDLSAASSPNSSDEPSTSDDFDKFISWLRGDPIHKPE